MICPEGFFTPKALTSEFLRVLNNDRVAPKVFASANRKFDDISARDRERVFEVSAELLAQAFIAENKNSAFIFGVQRTRPWHVDAWILQSCIDLPLQLPATLSAANASSKVLATRYAHLDTRLWVVDKTKHSVSGFPTTRLEFRLLPHLDGSSVCFSTDLWPEDFGAELNGIARRMSQKARTAGIQAKRPGRKPKVDTLAKTLATIHPNGLPSKTAKEFRRDLEAQGVDDFCDTTLRTAIDMARN